MFGPFYARSLAFAICVALATLSPHAARAHVDGHPSVHDTVSAIRTRMTTGMPLETLRILTRPELVNFLTDEERSVLGSEHLSFTLAEAATVYVMHDVGLGDDPFWLTARDFAKTDMSVMIDGDPFERGVGVELSDHATEAAVERLGSADGVGEQQAAEQRSAIISTVAPPPVV